MKTYAEQYELAAADNKAVDRVTEYLTLEEGQVLIGKLLDIEEFEGNQEMGSCKRYIIDSDDGLVSLLLGQATDKQLENHLQIGEGIYVMYRGKIRIAGGQKQVNKYVVRSFPLNGE